MVFILYQTARGRRLILVMQVSTWDNSCRRRRQVTSLHHSVGGGVAPLRESSLRFSTFRYAAHRRLRFASFRPAPLTRRTVRRRRHHTASRHGASLNGAPRRSAGIATLHHTTRRITPHRRHRCARTSSRATLQRFATYRNATPRCAPQAPPFIAARRPVPLRAPPHRRQRHADRYGAPRRNVAHRRHYLAPPCNTAPRRSPPGGSSHRTYSAGAIIQPPARPAEREGHPNAS